MDNNHNEAVAAEVRAALARSKRQVKDVAHVLGVSTHSASRKVNGHVPLTAVDLILIATLTGTSPAQFFPSKVAA